MSEGPQRPDPTAPAKHARDETAYRECTRNPVFLFQRKRYVLTGDPIDRGYVWDGEEWLDPDKPEGEREVSWATLEERELAAHYWETEGVWLSREEGNAYGKARAHNYPEGGWRVFCVPAEGELRALVDPTEPVR